jgi:hypothetical protein
VQSIGLGGARVFAGWDGPSSGGDSSFTFRFHTYMASNRVEYKYWPEYAPFPLNKEKGIIENLLFLITR